MLKAVCILPHIIHIRPAVFDDELCHPQSQGTVCTGFDFQENIRQILGGRGIPDVNDNDLPAPLLQTADSRNREMVRIVSLKVPAKESVSVCQIGRSAASCCYLAGDCHGCKAGTVICSEIHTAEHMGKTVQNRPVPLAVAAEKGHRTGTVLRLDSIQLFGDDRVSLIPCDRFKPAISPLTYPLERRFNAISPIHIISQRRPLST